MSALWAADDDADRRPGKASRGRRGREPGTGPELTRPRHSAAASRKDRTPERSGLSRVPFVLVLIVVFGIGMAGLLALNTSLQGQSFQARTLHNRADKLGHREAVLNRKTQDLRAPDRLAEQAWELGLRPNNRHTVFKLSDGEIVGKPRSASKKGIKGIKPQSDKSSSGSAAAEKAKKQNPASAGTHR